MRSILIVKPIKGENIPIQKSHSSKPYVEVQILPVKAEPIQGLQGIEFQVMPEELIRQTVHFCISRYDTFSRKSTIGDVFLSLAELTAERVDLSHEIFLKNAIKPNIEVCEKNEEMKRHLIVILYQIYLRKLKNMNLSELYFLTFNTAPIALRLKHHLKTVV